MNISTFIARDPNQQVAVTNLGLKVRDGKLHYKNMHSEEMDWCTRVLLTQRFRKDGTLRNFMIVPFNCFGTDPTLSPCPLKFDRDQPYLDTTSQGSLSAFEIRTLQTDGYVRQELANFSIEYLKVDLPELSRLRRPLDDDHQMD